MNDIYVDVWDINTQTIDTNKAIAFVQNGSNGANALFLGVVRNLNHGKQVLGVSYDVYDELAKNSFKEICEEARQQWGEQLKLYIIHAKGRLDIGGVSIVIAAGTPHRDESFKACRYVIEEIKKRSPVWKKEHYVGGDSEWVQGHALCSH